MMPPPLRLRLAAYASAAGAVVADVADAALRLLMARARCDVVVAVVVHMLCRCCCTRDVVALMWRCGCASASCHPRDQLWTRVAAGRRLRMPRPPLPPPIGWMGGRPGRELSQSPLRSRVGISTTCSTAGRGRRCCRRSPRVVRRAPSKRRRCRRRPSKRGDQLEAAAALGSAAPHRLRPYIVCGDRRAEFRVERMSVCVGWIRLALGWALVVPLCLSVGWRVGVQCRWARLGTDGHWLRQQPVQLAQR